MSTPTLEAAAQRLAAYVKARSDDQLVAECHDEAVELVTNHVGTVTVPGVVLARAVLEVGADLYHRRAARNGIAQFDAVDVAPMRIRANPIDAARPLLAPYLGAPIA